MSASTPPTPAPTTDPSVRPDDRAALQCENARVLAMLEAGPLDAIDALDFGIMRLAARIHDLRRAGWRITTERRGRLAVYRLER